MTSAEPTAKEVYQHTCGINAIRYQPASGLLYCGTQEGSLLVLDTQADFRVVQTILTGLHSVGVVDVHAAAPIAVVSGQGIHQVWDCTRQVKLLEECFSPNDQYGSNGCFCLGFHVPPPGAPPSDWVIFSSFGGFVALNVRTGEKQPLFVGSDCNVSIAFHPAGDFGAVSCLEPQDSTFLGFFEFSPASGKSVPYAAPLIRFEPAEDADPNETTDVPAFIAFNPSGNRLVSAWSDLNFIRTEDEVEEWGALVGIISVYRFPECSLIHEIEILGRPEDMVHTASFYEETGEEVTLYGTPGFVSNVVLLGDGGSLAACGTPTGGVALVDWEQGEVVSHLPLHDGEVTCVDAIGRAQVISAGRDGRLFLLDVPDMPGTASQPDVLSAATAEATKQAFLDSATEGDGSFYPF